MADESSSSAISRDIARKKRTNRSAKLKQCKLDARREQWLSQVRSKDCMVTSRGMPPVSPPPHPALSRKLDHRLKEREEKEEHYVAGDGSPNREREIGSPTNGSPINGCANNSVSSGSSFGSSSRSISDAEADEDDCEEREDDKEGMEDWEALADALSDSHDRSHPEPKPLATVPVSTPKSGGTNEDLTKHESKRTIPRAWRPDDAFRPRSLPNLSKQRSFPMSMERHFSAAGWAHHGIIPAPSTCPICYEDLDPTDSSFLPCSCGFRLCLFCHKRILDGDGRCPGCRKHYAPAAGGEVGIGGGGPPLALHLSRSCSMRSRT